MRRLDASVESRIRAHAGRQSDAALAAAIGCSAGVVARVRRAAGLAPWRPASAPLAWPAARLALLGAMADGKLARRWGISRAAVQAKRLELGRPASDGRVTTVFLSPAVRSQLGRHSDAVLAARYRISVAAVRLARRRAGIAGSQRARPVTWTPQMLADLAILPTGAFCRAHRVSNRTVALKRSELGCAAPRRTRRSQWTEEMLARLGSASDRALAAAWGLREDTVRKRRARLGLAAWRGKGETSATR